MKKLSRKRKLLLSVYKKNEYSLIDGLKFLKENSLYNFNESIDISIKFSDDFKNKNIKGNLSLPYNTFKFNRILFFIENDKFEYYHNIPLKHKGSFDLIEKILSGFCDFDFVVSSPKFLENLYSIKDILDKRNIFPNISNGSVTYDIEKFIRKCNLGYLNFKINKNAIVNTSIGKLDFNLNYLRLNFYEFLNFFLNNKNYFFKIKSFKKIFLSSTMGLSINISFNDIFNI